MLLPFPIALISVIIVSLLSLIGAAIFLFRDSVLQRGMFLLVSLAVGALFGDAVIHLIPEAFEQIGNGATASLYILTGIVGLFVLEKFLHWRHVHSHDTAEGHHDEEVVMREQGGRIKPLGYLVLISDGIHNFIDGILIGASYLVSIEVGIATTLAVILHEIPHEFSDFGLLIHAGFTKGRALLMNFFSALTAILGTVVAFSLGGAQNTLIPILVAFGAGSFLYIAGSDLVPELHKTSNVRHSLLQFAAIVIGIAIMFSLLLLDI